MRKQAGQVILILLLVMTVGLAIGLSVIQRSITDISTASKVEQSSRAFSAAEAGIEQVLRGGGLSVDFAEIGAKATVEDPGLLPAAPALNQRQAPLEYPPLAKEEVAQIWLADYNSLANPPPPHYNQTSLDVYWGSSLSDKAALEITLIYYEAASYKTRKWYLDHPITRTPDNKFEQIACGGYSLGANQYQCQKTLESLPTTGMMLVRARLLYNSTSQPFAVQGVGTCGTSCSLPSQSKNITSTGISGETQRKVKVFQLNKVVPPYLDYAIFSVGEIGK